MVQAGVLLFDGVTGSLVGARGQYVDDPANGCRVRRRQNVCLN